MNEIVKVSGLKVVARSEEGVETPIVHGVDFAIGKGEVLALIGESGSGKTTIALSLMGYARRGCRIVDGTVRIGDIDVLSLSPRELSRLRGRTVSYIAQSAAAAFNPAKTIMDQVIESALIHRTMTRRQAKAKAVELFHALALPEPERIGSRFPHQVSGGQLQRLMAAMALITEPALVVLDEPTTALDVTTQIEVLRAFKNVVRECGTTAVYVSHDLAVVAQMADQIIVLRDGRVQEAARTGQLLDAPAHPYTRSLLTAMGPGSGTAAGAAPTDNADGVLLQVRDLAVSYGPVMPGRRAVLEGIDLTIRRGATVGIIGESGSGKTTLARAIAGMIAPSQGQILLDGQPLPPTLEGRTREQFRRIQFAFQNADTALNPLHTIERILARPLAFYHGMSGEARRRRIAELLDLVRLPQAVARRRPGELSGGQKQRINLARALAAEPDLILCDEVTSALDTVVGAAILELMAELRRELNVSYLFISHDISTVRKICDEIVVLYAGTLVEQGPKATFRAPPYHPYTDLLIASVPEMHQGWLETARAAQGLPEIDLGAIRPGLCPFLPRCPVRIAGRCDKTPPPRVRLAEGNDVLCHHGDAGLRRVEATVAKLKAVG